jgi:hypothetical protein
MVGAAGFHQGLKSFILNNTKRPHTFGYALYDTAPFTLVLSKGERYEGEFLPSFFCCVISM